jgi:hypothetical protein
VRNRIGLGLGLLLVLTMAACGGADNKDGGVATVNGSGKPTSAANAGSGSESEGALRFAKCMRENGVDMPDPQVQAGGPIDLSLPEGVDPNKADSAMQKCKPLLPNGGEPTKADPQVIEAQRKFAKCMRENGVSNFPDPGENGGIQMSAGPGLDPNDPKFQAAESACAKYQPKPPSGGPQNAGNG